MTPWKQTYTGGIFLLSDPQPAQVRLADVAHVLALTCRFGGHCRYHYSVAQHSVLMAACTPGEPYVVLSDLERLALLLHDAAEAYTGDVAASGWTKSAPTPIKEFFGEVDRAVHAALGNLHTRDLAHAGQVKMLDRRMLHAEARALMVWPPPWRWDCEDIAPLYPDGAIEPWTPGRAEEEFLRGYALLAAACGLPEERVREATALRDAVKRENQIREQVASDCAVKEWGRDGPMSTVRAAKEIA